MRAYARGASEARARPVVTYRFVKCGGSRVPSSWAKFDPGPAVFRFPWGFPWGSWPVLVAVRFGLACSRRGPASVFSGCGGVRRPCGARSRPPHRCVSRSGRPDGGGKGRDDRGNPSIAIACVPSGQGSRRQRWCGDVAVACSSPCARPTPRSSTPSPRRQGLWPETRPGSRVLSPGH